MVYKAVYNLVLSVIQCFEINLTTSMTFPPPISPIFHPSLFCPLTGKNNKKGINKYHKVDQ